jgi:hypothetical protein
MAYHLTELDWRTSMKIKVSEATSRQLDWMVAKCEGYEIVRMRGNEITFLDRTDDGALNEKQISYSTNWLQGGPIIEREKIGIMRIENRQAHQQWTAGEHDSDYPNRFWEVVCGPTPLIAAMRCYVASKLGDTIEIPEELA